MNPIVHQRIWLQPSRMASYKVPISPATTRNKLSSGSAGHPFLDGNKRTAFFLANEYLRAHGLPGLTDEGRVGRYEDLLQLAEHHVDVAAGRADLEAFTRDK
ncbi:hypothetical protein ONZ45_g449 [Pleurotus djamor]|nr:hypothetical protein ONZ45_g449 [Pleurotus djamor]